jgi:hypothetical protein
MFSFSALSQDPTYEGVARRALQSLWDHRSTTTGLLGSSIDIHSGRWVNTMSGFGAGIDSFFEYLFKVSHISYYISHTPNSTADEADAYRHT